MSKAIEALRSLGRYHARLGYAAKHNDTAYLDGWWSVMRSPLVTVHEPERSPTAMVNGSVPATKAKR